MDRKRSKQLVQALCVFVFAFLVAPLSQSAESTADVAADAAFKENLRQQIIGQSVMQKVDDAYVVGYRDIVHVSVYGEGSMAVGVDVQPEAVSGLPEGVSSGNSNFLRGRGTGIEVRHDGRISLRHIGDVSVVGLTLTQIADYLKQLYSVIYDNPSLTVTLVQSNSQQYTVMGQVLNPGLYHLDFPLTIVQAVARAGGFTEWAKSDITVIRQKSLEPGGKKSIDIKGQTFKFDYDDFLKGQELEKNVFIKSGDVIVVH